MSFHVTFNSPESFTATFSSSEQAKAEFGAFVVVPEVDYFDGDYEITPSAEAQIIPIVGKTARQDITVGAIPNNYGLITWNGSTLTVS